MKQTLKLQLKLFVFVNSRSLEPISGAGLCAECASLPRAFLVILRLIC